MTTLLMVLTFSWNGVATTSQTIQFESMQSCEQAKSALTESVMKFKYLEQFHIGCYKGKE